MAKFLRRFDEDDPEIVVDLAESRWTRNVHGALVGMWRFANKCDPTATGAYCAADEVASVVNCKLVTQLLLTFEPDAPYKTAIVDSPGIITVAWMRSIARAVHLTNGRAVMSQKQSGNMN